MMWKNFNAIYSNNKTNNPTNNDNNSGVRVKTNMDCLIHVFNHLAINERVKCRLVCKLWREAVDKLFSGQNYLKIIYVSKKDDNYYKAINAINTHIMTKQIKFQLFHQMMTNFPSIHTLVVQNLPLTDVMILVMTTACRLLTTISLTSCIAKRDYYSNNYINNSLNSDSDQTQITSYGWKLLINTYIHLKQLTIRNCSLNDDDCRNILLGFQELTYLDVSDNDQLNGTCLHLLGKTCLSLCVGSLNSDVWMYPMLESLSKSNTQLRHLELKGGINQELSSLKRLKSLESLSLKFFCPQDQTIDTLSPISKLINLKQLSLHQERCYDESSAIHCQSFIVIANECHKLEELVITGEYGWRLRLDDYCIKVLVNKCQRLQRFALTGNSVEITDTSVHQLVLLPRLRSVSLTSFERITDEGLIHLICRHPALDYIGIKESSSISNATLNACIQVAKSDPSRRLSIFFAETKISKPNQTKLPNNLKVVFEENFRPRRQSDEPSAMKMIAVVGMSAVILAMILITMLVVIVMPIGMLLMMFYENCVEYAVNNADNQLLDPNNPLDILQFYSTQTLRYLSSLDIKTIIVHKISTIY